MADAERNSWVEKVLQDIKEKYAKSVSNNPETVAQIESAVRIISFFVAGRFHNGDVISELIYAGSNLLIFINDKVFKNASKYFVIEAGLKETLRGWLTVLEYIEVFLEMAAKRRWGDHGGWIVITIIQLTKTILRFVLLLKLDGGIICTPAVPPVDRQVITTSNEHDDLEDAWDEETRYSEEEKTFRLSTGRQIRTLHAAGHNSIRSWGVPKKTNLNPQLQELRRKRNLYKQPATKLAGQRLLGECLHVGRPLAHLLGMYICGQSSWKPWLLALGMDLTSNKLIGDVKGLNERERAELKRRNLMLLYFLMRSPFYDSYTKARLVAVLTFMAQYVPLTGLVMRPLLGYLPVWQRMYFYTWGT